MTDADLLALERELTSLALEGAGWTTLLDRLAQRTGVPASLIGVHGEPLVPAMPGAPTAISAGDIAVAFAQGHLAADVATVDGGMAIGLPVLAGARRIGLLAVGRGLDGEDVRERRSALLEAAKTAVAVEGVRRDTLQQARGENASQIVDELRYGSLRNPGRVARAAAKFGLALDEEHRGVVFHYTGSQRQSWATAVAWLPTPTRLSGDLAWTIVDGRTPSAELGRIRLRMQGIVGETPLLMSIGPSVRGSESTASSFRSAETGLGLLLSRGGDVLSFDDLGVEQLLMELGAAQLHAFVARQIGPILHRDDLMTTLAAWFELDGSRSAIAERLFIHRNSVGYRLSLIKSLLGDGCLEPGSAPRLLAGLQAHETALAMETFAAVERGVAAEEGVDGAAGVSPRG
ncbi:MULTISPECIES: PucR family transcriptional regulator [Bacteria]|uniref:PucR family transcriptional regulator n=1 Tax=Bacteria TaxID=2 RepID=UPI003C7A2CDE